MLGTDKLFDWYLARQREYWEPRKDRRRDSWSASSLGYCLRRQVLERRGVPPFTEPDEKTQRMFAWGDQLHKWVRTVYARCGLLVAQEVVVTDERRNIRGHIDAIITTDPEDEPPADLADAWSDEWVEFIRWLRGEYRKANLEAEGEELARLTRGQAVGGDPKLIGLELKSQHSAAMKLRMAENRPMPHHEMQLAAYALMAQTTPPVELRDGRVLDLREVEDWRFVYIGRDAFGVLTFGLTVAMVEAADARIDELNAWWESGKLPPCTCDDTWEGSYCIYREFGSGCCLPDA